MVSARPQFEAACQLQKFAGLAQWQCRELVPLRRVFDSLDQLQIRWRDWPNGLGTGLWLRSREFASLISPQWYEGSADKLLCPRQLLALIRRARWLTRLGGSYKGITHGLHP